MILLSVMFAWCISSDKVKAEGNCSSEGIDV